MINYNEASKSYDITRKANLVTVRSLLERIDDNCDTNILDFGCGTGNFTCALKEMTKANVFGVEPSDGMRAKAVEKNSGVVFKKGNHEDIPFSDGYFNLIYMTDVIHHVPDIRIMFEEFYRVLKKGGLVCIITESHAQIESRFWVKYFPSTVPVEKARYPDIPVIIKNASKNGLTQLDAVITDKKRTIRITSDFVKLVEQKGYSMFRLIDDKSYDQGLMELKKDYEMKVEIEDNHGETLVWLVKKG